MYTWFFECFLYKAGRSGLLRLTGVPHLAPVLASVLRVLPHAPPTVGTAAAVRPMQTGVKIDLYIFIYASIKKGEEGVRGGGLLAELNQRSRTL